MRILISRVPKKYVVQISLYWYLPNWIVQTWSFWANSFNALDSAPRPPWSASHVLSEAHLVRQVALAGWKGQLCGDLGYFMLFLGSYSLDIFEQWKANEELLDASPEPPGPTVYCKRSALSSTLPTQGTQKYHNVNTLWLMCQKQNPVKIKLSNGRCVVVVATVVLVAGVVLNVAVVVVVSLLSLQSLMMCWWQWCPAGRWGLHCNGTHHGLPSWRLDWVLGSASAFHLPILLSDETMCLSSCLIFSTDHCH